MRLRSFRKKAEVKALQKRKMKPWRFRKKAESKVRQKDVHREGQKAYGLVHSVIVLTTR